MICKGNRTEWSPVLTDRINACAALVKEMITVTSKDRKRFGDKKETLIGAY